jgi:hypothetical protein
MVQDLKWKATMDKEIKTIEKNKTWEMANLPEGPNRLASSGYIRRKYPIRDKTRLIVKGYW